MELEEVFTPFGPILKYGGSAFRQRFASGEQAGQVSFLSRDYLQLPYLVRHFPLTCKYVHPKFIKDPCSSSIILIFTCLFALCGP